MKVKLKKTAVFCLKILPFLLIAALFLCVFLYPKGQAQEKRQKRAVIIWNIDTFEGGKGSRTNFLKSVARTAETQDNSLYYMIASYTKEGAEEAVKKGDFPDILSFGVGFSACLEQSVVLPYRFSGGTLAGSCRAYPWCKGAYYLFSITDDFTEEGSTVISSGGENLAEVAAALEGISGEISRSMNAYVAFLSGKYRYLLGTQRDVCRFASRSVTVYSRQLTDFCDLYQYVSVLSKDKMQDCMRFLDVLLSDEMQNKLDTVGMYPVTKGNERRTISVFTDGEALDAIRNAARGDDAAKNLDKFLKNI